MTYDPSAPGQPWQQQEYNVPDFSQPQYPPAAPGYPPPGPAQPGYPVSGAGQAGYPVSGAGQSGYPVSGGGPAGYPPPGQPGPATAQPGYPQPGPAVQPGYPAPGYPGGGYPASGYPGPGYPGAGYPGAVPPAPPVKRRNTGLIVAVVVAVLILCVGGGVAGVIWAVKKAQPAKPQTVAIGTTLTVKSTDGATAEVTVSDPHASDGDVFVSVQFRCTSGSFPVNPLYLTLRDAAGTEYDVDFGAEQDFLEPGRLPAGQTESGDVAFTAPESLLHGGVIELDAPFKAVAYWTLDG